jgi:hypothetical protein
MENMMTPYRCLMLSVAFAFGLFLSACDGGVPSDKNAGAVPPGAGSLPVYDGVTELEALIMGRLSIEGECVFLIDPANTKTIIVFPKGSRLSANRQSVQTLGKIARNGALLGFSGASTTRTFWKSLAPDVAYQPIPDSCKGDTVWLAGQMTVQ